MAVTQSQRITDLLFAGHSAADIDGLLGCGVSAVQAAAQDLATVKSPASAAAVGSAALTVVSGTAQQDATHQPSSVYVAITGGAAGTVKVDAGPTSGVAVPIIPAGDATLSRTLHFRLPPDWYFKVTVTGSAAVGATQQVTGA